MVWTILDPGLDHGLNNSASSSSSPHLSVPPDPSWKQPALVWGRHRMTLLHPSWFIVLHFEQQTSTNNSSPTNSPHNTKQMYQIRWNSLNVVKQSLSTITIIHCCSLTIFLYIFSYNDLKIQREGGGMKSGTDRLPKCCSAGGDPFYNLSAHYWLTQILTHSIIDSPID